MLKQRDSLSIFFNLLLLGSILAGTEEKSEDPCSTEHCGPSSVCEIVVSRPVCSCMAGYVGTPPNCRPQCSNNADCSASQACINRKCANPCPGTCGSNSECSTINHSPACTCLSGFTGEPFVKCSVIKSKQWLSTNYLNYGNWY